MKIKYKFLLFCVFFSISLVNVFAQKYQIKNYTSLTYSLVSLDDNWEFFPRVFIEPNDNKSKTKYIVSIPNSWSSYKVGGEFDENKGAASYRLRVTGLNAHDKYSFSCYDLAATSLKIIINGKLLFQAGQPSLDYENTISDQKMGLVEFSPDLYGEAEIILHVSNSFHRKAGIWSSIKLGNADYLRQLYVKQKSITLVFVGALFLIFLYQFALALFRRYDLGSLYISLFTLSILIRILVTPCAILKMYFQNIPYSWLLKLEYTPLVLGPLFFLLYSEKQISSFFNKNIVKVITIIGIVLAISLYVFPVYVSCRMVTICQIYTILVCIYLVIMMIKHYIKTKSTITKLILLSTVFILLGTLHDIISLSTPHFFLADTAFVPYAFILFVFFQSIIIANQHEQLQIAVEKLSSTLYETNKAYYRFIPREFLELLNKKNITDVHVGEWVVKNITLLSADIRNFTAISEQLNGKQVFDFLNKYLMRIAPIIRENGGFIEKYLGDGIVALFPEDGKGAFHCAIDMQKEINLLREEFYIERLPIIEIGIGLHYGKTVLGTVGEHNRMNEITVSKAIETVISLESLTKIYKHPIIASSTVIKKWNVDDEFKIELLPPEEAHKKGINEEIYAIYS